MRRHHQLKTWALLYRMYAKAMGRTFLPPAFAHAVKLMSTGLHPNVFKGAAHLRTIMISETMRVMSDFQGVYFGRVESTFPKDDTDWESFGWDGVGRFMMFPEENPQTWVILHEFAHYLDEIYFSKQASDFMCLGYHPSKINQFIDWKQEARFEYYKVHGDARTLLEDRIEDHGGANRERTLTDPRWYEHVPNIILNRAPSRYGLVTFAEWIAESYRRYFIDGEDFLIHRCPDTHKFLKFAIGGEMFHRIAVPEPKPISQMYEYAEVLPYPKAPVRRRMEHIPYTYEGGHNYLGDDSEWDEHE